MGKLDMSWNEDSPEPNPDHARWLKENKAREDYEQHGPSEGLEIGKKAEPASLFKRVLAFFQKR